MHSRLAREVCGAPLTLLETREAFTSVRWREDLSVPAKTRTDAHTTGAVQQGNPTCVIRLEFCLFVRLVSALKVQWGACNFRYADYFLNIFSNYLLYFSLNTLSSCASIFQTYFFWKYNVCLHLQMFLLPSQQNVLTAIHFKSIGSYSCSTTTTKICQNGFQIEITLSGFCGSCNRSKT